MLGRIRTLLGETGIRFEPDGRVEFLIREADDGSVILYLANWEYRVASPVLGLDLLAGHYRTTLCGGDSFVLKQGLLNGQAEVEANLFRRFGLTLAPREVVLLRLEAVAGGSVKKE
ncbi:MAG TPA: hypothetical protein PK644_00680 [bacterium]|nr:hypothetical protein [bacterium]